VILYRNNQEQSCRNDGADRLRRLRSQGAGNGRQLSQNDEPPAHVGSAVCASTRMPLVVMKSETHLEGRLIFCSQQRKRAGTGIDTFIACTIRSRSISSLVSFIHRMELFVISQVYISNSHRIFAMPMLMWLPLIIWSGMWSVSEHSESQPADD
jgi:hypothetical protein